MSVNTKSRAVHKDFNLSFPVSEPEVEQLERLLRELTQRSNESTTKTEVLEVTQNNLQVSQSNHATQHQNGGTDEISIAGLSGLTSDVQRATFIFRPGGVQQNNVYTVWADLMTALNAVEGSRILEFDDTLGVITIPSGTYDMKGVAWLSDLNRLQTSTVNFATGAVITNLGEVVHMLILKNIGTGAVITWDVSQRIVFGLGCQLQCVGGAGPLIEVDAINCNLGLDDGALINNTGAPAVNVKPGGQLIISGNVATQVINNTISSDDATASMILFTAAASAVSLSPNHSAFSGTITEVIAPISRLVQHNNVILDGFITVSVGLESALHPFEKNTAGSGSPNLLSNMEHLKSLSNEGATAKNFHTLPVLAVTRKGVTYTFLVQDADGMRIKAGGTDTIRIGQIVTKAGGFVESLEVGATMTLKAIDDGAAAEWFASSGAGNWILETA